jgi:hypothetical protein
MIMMTTPINDEEKKRQLKIRKFNSLHLIQFNSIQFNSIQFNSIQFNSIQFNSIQFMKAQTHLSNPKTWGFLDKVSTLTISHIPYHQSRNLIKKHNKHQPPNHPMYSSNKEFVLINLDMMICSRNMNVILNWAINLRRTVEIQLFNLDLGCDDDIY